jgi:hypothetical protein
VRRSLWRAEGRTLRDKGWAPLRYWTLWMVLLVLADVLFYVILTPIWLGLRGAAWLAEIRSRVRR